MIYKLIAKVLANKLKKVLPYIISANQSAFIPGCLTTDNILVAFEALQTMNVRMKGKKRYIALKLDMSKAYDQVEWDFLEVIMVKIGLSRSWVDKVMVCVRTVSYSILINSQPNKRIMPSKGIRQGDPLSPFFFHLMCRRAKHFTGKGGARRENNQAAHYKGRYKNQSFVLCG